MYILGQHCKTFSHINCSSKHEIKILLTFYTRLYSTVPTPVVRNFIILLVKIVYIYIYTFMYFDYGILSRRIFVLQ